MKKTILSIILLTCVSTPLFAIPTVVVSDSYGNTGGGEFLITPSGFPDTPASLGEVSGKFETFCVEKDEFLSFGVTYNVDFGTSAVEGGVGGGSPDPLDIKTAYLYDQFISGTLNNYTYTPGAARVTSANALQDVIWVIEQEIAQSWVDGDASLEDKFMTEATNNATTIGDIRVMNLWDSHSPREEHQSLLVKIPAPGAILLGGIGISLVGYLRRRRTI